MCFFFLSKVTQVQALNVCAENVHLTGRGCLNWAPIERNLKCHLLTESKEVYYSDTNGPKIIALIKVAKQSPQICQMPHHKEISQHETCNLITFLICLVFTQS